MTGKPPDPLARVLAGGPGPQSSLRRPPFALLHRPGVTGTETLDVLVGEVSTPDSLAQVPLPHGPAAPAGPVRQQEGPRHETLVVVPYRQIAERGFACADDGSPLIAMTVTEQAAVPVEEALERIPDTPIRLSGSRFDADDDAYAETVRRIVTEEIGEGNGANFVIRRSFTADVTGHPVDTALSAFRRLLRHEFGAYWTFVIHTGDRTFLGASPERHISVHGGTAVMNPVSGTYRYPPGGPTLPEVMAFLADRKETDELYMVVDEELKTMAAVCADGGQVTGPYLKEMARLAHTEYFIEGRTDRDPREILRETLFAPTVTGSPLESACRVIERYEPQGRGYYSGVAALIGRDGSGQRTLDSAILIRTADIDPGGRLRIGVGSTLVRHSDPHAEAAETQAKAAGLLSVLESPAADAGLAGEQEPSAAPAPPPVPAPVHPVRFAAHPDVQAALARRNDGIAGFWLEGDGERARPEPSLAGRRVLVVDAEDTFTLMLAHQLRATGLEVTVRRFDEPYVFRGHDLVVMGPGPGDPREEGHPKIAHLRSAVRQLLDERWPFLAVCLSHQVLSRELGLDIVRRDVPNQGAQHEIDLFGGRERVGFYNTFAARCGADRTECHGVGPVEVSRDKETDEVYALRGPHFASMQFHAESLLTQDGIRIVATELKKVLGV